MSENLNELCCLLVEEFYGEFHRRLYSNLTYYGRLSAPQLAQKTCIPLKQVKAGLSVLIQSRIVFHHTTSEGLSTYQANTDATYRLLRSGRLVELVRTELGSLGAQVMTEACLLGFATIAELESTTYEQSLSHQPLTTNGDHVTAISETERRHSIHITIQRLLDRGYLYHVRIAQFQTLFDAKQDIERYFRSHGMMPSSKGKKGAVELDDKIETELRRRVTPKTAEHGYVPDISQLQKRALEDTEDQPSAKRQKVNDSGSSKVNGGNGVSSGSDYMSNATLVCVDFNSVVASIGKKQLAEKAKKRLGGSYSLVLTAALSQVTYSEQPPSPTEEAWLDVREIQQEVNRPESEHLRNGHYQNGTGLVNGTHAHEDETDKDKVTYNEVDRALAQLLDAGFHFLQGAYGQDWRISKQKLQQTVREDEIYRMVGGCLEAPALRIVRMLKEKGKLDEKTLQEIGLLGAKELRQTLAQLKQMGFIDLQEVPRESQRQPNRTIFLWFHDPDRVQKILVDGLYKAMVRLMQRLRLERNKLASTLEKIERSDVRGNEEQIMSAAELRVLRRWQRTEQWLLGEVARLDESVALLKDL